MGSRVRKTGFNARQNLKELHMCGESLELAAARVYRALQGLFAGNGEVSGFFSALAAEEEEHAKFFRFNTFIFDKALKEPSSLDCVKERVDAVLGRMEEIESEIRRGVVDLKRAFEITFELESSLLEAGLMQVLSGYSDALAKIFSNMQKDTVCHKSKVVALARDYGYDLK
ncbi:MAG: hypothetical protein OEV59_07535 [Deltaproteobacteria bacterium]|nr:hypothetical protein [Deltaproteobacteria bacterium]